MQDMTRNMNKSVCLLAQNMIKLQQNRSYVITSYLHRIRTKQLLYKAQSSKRYFAITKDSVNESKINMPLVDLRTISFNDPQSSFALTPTSELIKKGVLFSSMQFRILYQNAGTILNIMSKLLGKPLVMFIVKHSLFQHFCGGETLQDLLKAGETLAKRGVGAIIDYAAEADDSNISNSFLENNVKLTKEGIMCAQQLREKYGKHDFAYTALKATALCNFSLLENVTACLNLFHFLYGYGIGDVPKEAISFYNPKDHNKYTKIDMTIPQAKEVLNFLFPSLKTSDIDKIVNDIQKLPGGSYTHENNSNGNHQINDNHSISYFQWTTYFSPEQISMFPQPKVNMNSYVTKSSLKKYWLTSNHISQWKDSMQRFEDIFNDGQEKNVRLLLDAESTNIQTAIDWIATKTAEQRAKITSESNLPMSLIYNTYQMYLKNTYGRLLADIERAERLNYKLSAKIVRGAYISYETKLSKSLGTENPIHNQIEDTHADYDKAIKLMIDRAPKSELVLASHNEESIKKAARYLGEITSNNPNSLPITFAQLYAMCDYVTYQLANAGVRAMKYTPYGQVDLVFPYLIRRAEENSSIFGNAGKESKLIWREVRRRFFQLIGL